MSASSPHPSALAAIVTLALLPTGCAAPEPPPDAPLAELCDAAGPVHLLPLSPQHRPLRDESIVRVDDRIVLIVGTDDSKYGFEHTTVYALGACGEDPMIIGDTIDRVFTTPQWPGVVFACEQHTHDLLRLDPTGGRKPERLAEAVCDYRRPAWGPAGLVQALRDDPMTIVFYPYAAAPAQGFAPMVILLDEIPYPEAAGQFPIPLFDGVFARMGDDLVYADLDGNTRIEQPGVRYFDVTPDGRYLIWQDLASADPDAEFPEGDIFVRDRETDASTFVTHAYLPSRNGNAVFPAPDTAQVTLGETLAGQWVVDLPTLSIYQLPPGRQLNERTTDGRWVVRSSLFGPYLLRDLASGGETTLTDRKGIRFNLQPEHLDLLESSGSLNLFTSTRLLRFPIDGGEPRVLATRATRGAYYLPDDRLVSPVHIGSNKIGDLILVDLSTREELLIDDHVAADVDHARWHEAFGPDIVAYNVVDGDRSGVWLARPR